MTEISTTDIMKIASLARLGISAAEIERYKKDLANIMDLIEHIQEADTTGITLATSPQETALRTRNDEVTETVSDAQKQKLQQAAPRTELDLYLVPRVVEEV
jgi:aspartyl-tRNA(Asn)/glutamyl-tRNA(Gln) amidotransferase subunit C